MDNNAVLVRVMAIIKFLSHQCLTFRGLLKILYEHGKGNFLSIFTEFNPRKPKIKSCDSLYKISNSEWNNWYARPYKI